MENKQEMGIDIILTIKIVTDGREVFFRYISNQSLDHYFMNLGIDSDIFVKMVTLKNILTDFINGEGNRFITQKVDSKYLKNLLPDNSSDDISGYIVLSSKETNHEINILDIERHILNNINQILREDVSNVYSGGTCESKRIVNFFKMANSANSEMEKKENSSFTKSSFSESCDFYPMIYSKTMGVKGYQFLSHPPFLEPYSYKSECIGITTDSPDSSNLLIFITSDNRLFLGKCVPVTEINPDYIKFENTDQSADSRFFSIN